MLERTSLRRLGDQEFQVSTFPFPVSGSGRTIPKCLREEGKREIRGGALLRIRTRCQLEQFRSSDKHFLNRGRPNNLSEAKCLKVTKTRCCFCDLEHDYCHYHLCRYLSSKWCHHTYLLFRCCIMWHCPHPPLC